MEYKDVSKLDDLCIRMDGLANLGLVIRDGVIDGPNSADSYKDAINLFADLLYEFRNEFNTAAQEIFSKINKKV